MPDKDELKIQKKLAKTEAKAAKKNRLPEDLPFRQGTDPVSSTAPDRSAEIAEKELALHRWRVIFAAVSVLIALVSLIVLLVKS
jgi:hypothetical protein